VTLFIVREMFKVTGHYHLVPVAPLEIGYHFIVSHAFVVSVLTAQVSNCSVQFVHFSSQEGNQIGTMLTAVPPSSS
jgi:hypothetical protein